MGYSPYEDYKYSGIDTIGLIPQHWSIRRLKFMAKIQNGKDYKEVVSDEGFPVIGSGGEFAKANSYLYNGESVLLGRKGTIDRPLYINGPFWTVDTMFYTEVSSNVCAKYLYYCALTINFLKFATSTALPSMTQQDLGTIPFAVPGNDEQQAIARFLDFKTAQIDALIAKQQSLLDKLAEKRTALISHAVTKGLDLSVPMKDSGVEWIGDLPVHWDVIELRYACEFLNRRRVPLSAEERGTMSERVFPYYGASGIIDYVEDYIFDEKTILIAEDGANLLSRSTPLAFIADGQYWVNNHAHILKPVRGPFEYWSNLLCIIQYDPWITGSAQPKLSKENLGGIKLPLPPEHEQASIVKYIVEHFNDIDPMVKKIQDVIRRLNEYRSALITNTVTGKIDVRGFQIQG